MLLLGARYMTLEEHKKLLSSAGFSDVDVFSRQGRGWMCAVAAKTSQRIQEPEAIPAAAR